MRYISRSQHELMRKCLRAGYWQYLSGPWGQETRGLTPRVTAKPLALGICWHKAAERLLAQAPPEDAAHVALVEAEKYEALGEIEKNWLLGACLAWGRAAAPAFFDEYQVLSIEEQLETAISPNVILQSRADAVLQRRNDGTVWVLNWKTTGKDLKNFNAQFRWDVQSWTEALAVEAKLGLPVAGTVYYGVWKGPIWNGNMTSRLVYGYKYQSAITGEWTYTPEYKKGLKRFEVWNESFPWGDGVAAWIQWLPEEFLAKHFALAPPVLRNDHLVEKWLRQVVRREADIDNILEGTSQDVEDYFAQSWGEQCERCPFMDICTERTDPETLMAEGILAPRVDHHVKLEEDE